MVDSRIDERQVIELSSRTNQRAQPFTLCPDSTTELPSFDQWINPALEKAASAQAPHPSLADSEFDRDLTMSDPDPVKPFFVFLHAGSRRVGEVGHFVRRMTNAAVQVVSIDTKRCGYAHNVLLPRVVAWIHRLLLLTLCLGILLSAPCGPFAPQKLDQSSNGPTAIFNASNPDGIKLPDGSTHPLAVAALRLHGIGLDCARIAHRQGKKVIAEHPVNHGKDSLWPIKGREQHSRPGQ